MLTSQWRVDEHGCIVQIQAIWTTFVFLLLSSPDSVFSASFLGIRCFSKALCMCACVCVFFSLGHTVCICPLLSVLFYDLFVQINSTSVALETWATVFFWYASCDYYSWSHMHTAKLIIAVHFALIHCRWNHSRGLAATRRIENLLHRVRCCFLFFFFPENTNRSHRKYNEWTSKMSWKDAGA